MDGMVSYSRNQGDKVITAFRVVCFIVGFMCMIAAVDSFIVGNHSQALAIGCAALMFNAAFTYRFFFQEASR